jgi:NAD(P)-dependent dehydrogenase (short-subunit alcohol dehydrogenase family)
VVNRLDGKRALITGGASGIGLAAGRRFVEEGAAVLLAGRREQALQDAVGDLEPAYFFAAQTSARARSSQTSFVL